MSKITIKKIDEDDILEILCDYFLEHEDLDCNYWRGQLIGTVGKDLRFIGMYGDRDDSNFQQLLDTPINVIDDNSKYNGSHAFVKKLHEEKTND